MQASPDLGTNSTSTPSGVAGGCVPVGGGLRKTPFAHDGTTSWPNARGNASGDVAPGRCEISAATRIEQLIPRWRKPGELGHPQAACNSSSLRRASRLPIRSTAAIFGSIFGRGLTLSSSHL